MQCSSVYITFPGKSYKAQPQLSRQGYRTIMADDSGLTICDTGSRFSLERASKH